jgi:hypothetical protein
MSWKENLAAMDRMVAGYFDEDECRLISQMNGISGNHPSAPDPSRPTFDFLGTVELQPPSDIHRRAKPSDPGTRGDVVSYDAVLTAFVTDWPWRPFPKDILKTAAKTYRVETSEKDGSDRPAYYLTEIRHVVG